MMTGILIVVAVFGIPIILGGLSDKYPEIVFPVVFLFILFCVCGSQS